ncbi:hypothetical protein B5M09_010628 [Aphanomyces astaci]|uniref:Beta-lactamase-related domain-containing protein n=1 Tax=Aphanomyces astaci TaxID=112090 RepID=A0A3R7Y0F9_APHAT|nr:hypothetical protein B5M09_010628 [Aphanomyces astaci]
MDEYAASHTTVGDLLSHNSVINMMDGAMAVTFAVHATGRPLVEALRHLHTTHDFRSGYSPTWLNSIILGQVVEAVTNQTWHAYILDAVATPLHMDDTKGRPADAPPSQLTSGHLFCNGTVIGPFSLANSTMMSFGPQGAYVAGSSMVASLNDVTKLSLALLPRHKHDRSKQAVNQTGDSGGLLFQSPKTLAEITTGQSFNSLMTNVGPWLGLSYSPSGNSLAAGYGFDIVGDVMHGEHFFGVLGVAGYVPSHGLGVVLMSNAEAAVGGLFSAQMVIPLVHSYILGVYLDIPIATLENEFANAIAAIDHRAPVLPCDPHYFENKPWGVPGVVIPDKTKRQLVGTYNSTESVFYGGVAVYIDHEAKDRDLVLQYGEYARRLIATGNDGVYMWALEARGMTFVVQFVDKDASAVQLHFFGKSFFRRPVVYEIVDCVDQVLMAMIVKTFK